jgi:hypothetical protein
MLLGVQESVREQTPTFPSELPLWQFESQWIFESSKGNCMGQNSLDWQVPFIIGNLLELRCLKWARMTHLDTSNTSYGQMKGQESNCQFNSRRQFDSWPLKVENRPNFLAWRWHATYLWKDFKEGYNFASNLTSIKGLHTKLWASKVTGLSILGISGLPLGSPGTKWHSGASLMAKHKEYYKGGGGGFPQARAPVNLMSPCLFVVHWCIKSAPTMQ